ncbi:hypothetical protein D9M71_744620 [compost metagenome]
MLLDFTGQLDLGLVIEGHWRHVFLVDFDSDGASAVLEFELVIVVQLLHHEALQHHRGVVGSIVGCGDGGHRLSTWTGITGRQSSGAEQRGKQQSEVAGFHVEDPVWVSMEPDYPSRLN